MTNDRGRHGEKTRTTEYYYYYYKCKKTVVQTLVNGE